jgi:hypothetical protein
VPGASHLAAIGGLRGGGGLGHALVHLFIWHLIWRAGLGIWRVPTVGPFLIVAIGLAIVAVIALRAQRGPQWWNHRGGSARQSSNRSPRDW